MPVDPIINLGLPVVQSYLAGMAARRQQEEQALRQQQFAYGIQQDQQAQARDARDFGYRQQQDAQQQANADRTYGLNERQFGLSQQRFGLDQSQNDRQNMAFDQANERERAAQAAYGSQFPQIVQARGLSPDQLWDQAGSLAQQETAFRAAPSGVQQTLIRPAMDTVRDQQVAAAAQAKAWQNYQRAADQIINDPALGPEQRDDLIRQLREEFFQRMGIVGKHFGDIPSPAQIAQDAADLQLLHPMATPDRATAAVRMRGRGYPIGLGDANLTGRTPAKPDKSVPLTQDREYQALKLDLDAAQDELKALMESGSNAQIAAARQQVTDARAQLRAYLRSGGQQQPSAPQADPIDQAIQALSQRLGRPPTEDEVLQALQGTP